MPERALLLPGSLAARLVVNGLIAIAVAYTLVSFLIDPARLDTSELRRNSLLMNSQPLFPAFGASPFIAAITSSAILLLASLTGAILIGVPAGIAYAWSSQKTAKAMAWTVSTFAASLPAFFWAVALEVLMLLLFFQFGWRFLPMAGFGIDQHLVLPALALGIRPAAYVFRLTAIAVDEVRHADYVRTAMAKGLSDRGLLVRHVVPNAAPAIVTASVLAARGALSSLVIVEFVYVWGGAGLTFVQALGTRRFELAASLALSFAIGSALLSALAGLARSRMRVTR